MTKPVDRLNIYLAQARAGVDGPDAGSIVIGNEAADLDSMVSAILYGQLISTCGKPDALLAVPVVNCPRADFILRAEAVYLFATVGVDVDPLLFIDEIDLERLHSAGRLRLTLVDHNLLSAGQTGYEAAVEAIVDHHQDGGLYPWATPRTIEPVGSAATLVAEAILRDRPELLDAASTTLLLGTILLDTVNLDPAAERATSKDRAVAARLGSITALEADELFARLEVEKFNISGLGTGDLLRKDYKIWETPSGTYGMSTVLTSLEDWIARDHDLLTGIDAFVRSWGLACLVTMMAYTDSSGAFCRQLAVSAPDPGLLERLATTFETGGAEWSRLRPTALADTERTVFYTQHDTSISRKKLQPRLHRILSGPGDDRGEKHRGR